MRTSTCTATIFGPGDEHQRVNISYVFEKRSRLFDPSKIIVKEITIEDPLYLAPSGIYEDIQHSIALDLNVSEWRITIECIVEETHCFIGGTEVRPVIAA